MYIKNIFNAGCPMGNIISNREKTLPEDTLRGDWRGLLKVDPIPILLKENDIGLKNRVLRDILNKNKNAEKEPVIDDIQYKEIARKQKPDGSWRESGTKKSEENWTFITTLRSLYILLDRGSGWGDEVFEKGAGFLLGTQTPDGDFRGAYGPDIPAPCYTGMVLEVLLRGNCPFEMQIEKAFEWLLDVRRNDGGWAILELRSKSKHDPSSHMVTGMALRGFASDTKKRFAKEAKRAGQFLAERIFTPDNYPDRRAVEYWGKLSYPFWFTDALSALDVLSRLGFDLSEGRMQRAFDWVIKQQDASGYWKSNFHRDALEPDPWLTYAVIRTIKKLL